MANPNPNEAIPAPDSDLGLGFANTRYWRGTATPTEQLDSPEDLLRWAATQRLPPNTVGRFTADWRERPDAAAAGLDGAKRLREAIFRIFAGTAGGHPPPNDDMAALNTALAAAPPRRRLRLGAWEIGAPDLSLGTLLAPTLWSAADLLVGPQLRLVRQCANPECGWLFLDNSKSGNRRWCSMSACGNRAKAHRHYLRQKAK